MALQDLTPQLRTRLSRMERSVGWFVLLAIGLLLFGFCFYLYHMAERKGWFLTKAPYYTYVKTATGLKKGDPVKMMGFNAGVITDIQPMPASQFDYNVYVEFVLIAPNYGYIWTEGSVARVASADFLGNRILEVTKGTGGYPTFVFYPLRVVPVKKIADLPDRSKWLTGQDLYTADGTNLLVKAKQQVPDADALISAGYSEVVLLDTREERKTMTGIWNYRLGSYIPYTNAAVKYELPADEAPAVTERLEHLVSSVERALPGVFALTNQLSAVLSNAATLAADVSEVALSAKPAISNLSAATADLDEPGALGEWLIPTNINQQLDFTLTSAGNTLQTANTNLAALALNLSRSLDNLAGITSNLNQQVQSNSNLLAGVSVTISNANEFVHGLKRHWLLRSAFKEKAASSPAGPRKSSNPLLSPKDQAR